MRTSSDLRREADETAALARYMSRADMRGEILRLAEGIRREAEAAERAEGARRARDKMSRS